MHRTRAPGEKGANVGYLEVSGYVADSDTMALIGRIHRETDGKEERLGSSVKGNTDAF